MKAAITTMKVIILVIFGALTAGPVYKYSTMDKAPKEKAELNDKHYCTWEDCDHQGEEMNQWEFVSQWGYDEMSDGWCIEMTHFMNPHMTYEECEAYVFSGTE